MHPTMKKPTTVKTTTQTSRRRPLITMKPVQNPDRQTVTSPRITDTRYRFVPRKSLNRTTSRLKVTTTSRPVDQHTESSNQQSLEENLHFDGDTTELGDIALALQDIQQAPLPSSKPYIADLIPSTKPDIVPISNKTKGKFTTVTTPLMMSTNKLIRRRPINIFEKIKPTSITLFKPLSEYDYYEDGESILSKIPEHSKVLLHSNGIIECLDQGNFPHPISCRKFISCAKMDHGKVLGWEYTCPKNLSFDPIGGICNWSAGLGCNE